MLQRAASHAYSWWWASHIRTKQSKWMEQNLQDMADKVEAVLRLLQEDGDSFAKRAEMYYKGRPELINFVEETYRAYRALAERYDHLSKELQNANNTIASICPEQVPFMDEDDEDGSPKPQRKASEGIKPNAASKVPKPPLKDLKRVITTATKKFCTKKTPTKTSAPKEAIKSGLSKKEALEEIDKLQKKILTLQTVKEFVKSTYDNAIAKYWDTEEEIKELQERVSRLQDEFGEGMVIEDDEARRLMTEAALKTCQETLARLLVKQEKSFNETKIETSRVKAVREKLESLMHKYHYDQIDRKEPKARKDMKVVNIKDLDREEEKLTQQRQELQLLQNKIKEQFEAGSSASISVIEMAEKIDELVNEVISLETSVSSQDALVTRLRTETDELQSQIQTLEDDNAGLPNEKTDFNNKLREMDEKMQGIQDLNQMVENQNSNLQTHLTEARGNLDHLSEKVQNVKSDEGDEGDEVMDLSKRENDAPVTSSRTETDEFQSQIRTLQDEKASLINEKIELNNKLIEMNEKMQGMQDLKQPQNSNLQTHFTEAHNNRDHLSEKVQNVKSDEGDEGDEGNEVMDLSKRESDAPVTSSRTETDEFQSQIRTLQDEKASLINEKIELNNQLIEMTEKMQGMQDLKQPQNSNLQTHFTEAHNNRDHLSEKVQNVKPDERDEVIDISKRETDALVTRLRTETNELQSQIRTLEDDKANLINEKIYLNNKMREMNEKMQGIQNQRQMIETKDSNLQIHFTEAHCNLDHHSEKVQNVSPDEGDEIMDLSKRESKTSGEAVSKHEVGRQDALNQESDAIARSAPGITTGDQDLSQHKASREAKSSSESSGNQQEKNVNQIFSETQKTHEVHSLEQVATQEDEPDWRQLFMDGMQEKEKLLLSEYTNILRNYKDMKKKLSEVEKKNQEALFDTSLKLKELKTSNAMKDEEIKLLRRKLGLMERSLEGNEDLAELRAMEEPAEKEDEEIFEVDQPHSTSGTEEKFRMHIDEILEENLGFWLKFSTTFTEIQKFETTIKDLQNDVSKLEEKGKSSESVRQSVKSDARPIFKHLVEIQTELSVWLDKGALLKEELQHRSASLCKIQEEIIRALKASAEDDDFKFTSYQAAKFQGEVLNMKQENNKVADELQAGLDHVSSLQLEVEKDLAKMGEQFGLSTSKRQQNPKVRLSDGSRSQVPLGAFIFGVKPKKQKISIFSSITPGMQKKYRAMKGHNHM